MRLPPLFRFASLAAALVALVAACGGGGATPTPTSAPPGPTPSPVLPRPTAPLPIGPTATPAPATPTVPAAPRPTPTSAPTAAPSPGADAKRGGTLTGVQILSPRCLDPILNCTTGTITAVRGVFNKLVRPGQADGATAVPDLAERWAVSGDGRTFTFSLRRGVKFHNGTDFDAQDVLFSIDRIRDPEKYEARGLPRAERPTLTQSMWAVVSGAEAPDPFTVRVTLSKYSNAWFNSLLEVANALYVLPSDLDPAQGNRSPVGTGAYRFRSFDPGVVVRGERNPAYWKADGQGRPLPYIDAYEMFVIPDTNTLLAAFRTARGLWIRPINANRLAGQEERLRSVIPGMQSAPLASTLHTLFANNRGPFQDLRVRQALDLGLDRYRVNDVGFFGVGVVKHGVMIPPELNGVWSLPVSVFDNRPGYRQGEARRPDVARARELMGQAGFNAENPLRARVVIRASYADLMTVIVEDLKAIHVVPTAEGIVNVGADDTAELRKKTWDLTYFTALSGSDYPGFAFRQQFSSTFPGQGLLNAAWDYSDVDPLWEAFESEPDLGKQKQIVQDIQRKFLEKLYFVGLFRSKVFHAWWPAVRNMPRTQCCTVADVVEDFEAVWIDRDFKPFGDGTSGDTPRY